MMLLEELDPRYHAVEREFAPVSCVKADWSMKVFCATPMAQKKTRQRLRIRGHA